MSRKKPKTLTPEIVNETDLDHEREDSETESDGEPELLDDSYAPVVSDSENESASTVEVLPGEGSTAVATNDPLKRYLQEVGRYPMLSQEEEKELGEKLAMTGDISAAKKLVNANLRLVVKIAFEYKKFYSNVLDLIQEGNVGLMKAVSKFDPSRGVKLGYYATWWIRSYILKYLLDNFRLVKLGTTTAQKKLFYNLMREKALLESQGLLPSPKLMAEKLDVREKDVIEMQQRLSGLGQEVSLDNAIGGSDEGESRERYMDILPDETETADDRIAKEQLLQVLGDALPEFEKTLNEKEKKILSERILADEPKTLQEVADQYGLTRERVRQIENKVLLKLREKLRDYLPKPGEND